MTAETRHSTVREGFRDGGVVRDAKVMQILEGTHPIRRLVVVRAPEPAR